MFNDGTMALINCNMNLSICVDFLPPAVAIQKRFLLINLRRTCLCRKVKLSDYGAKACILPL